jgi:hypothetical protein
MHFTVGTSARSRVHTLQLHAFPYSFASPEDFKHCPSSPNITLYSTLLPLRCAAPEELVMPKDTPRAPVPALAALFAPFVWGWNRPDLFDTYAAGIILLQVGVQRRPALFLISGCS